MIAELKQFVGLKKGDYVFEFEKKFFHHDNITVCVMDVDFLLRELYPDVMDDSELLEKLKKKFPSLKYFSPFRALACTIVGKSVCTKDDVFDEKRGETIAYSKAQRKAYHIASRIALFISQYYEKKHAEACRVGHFLQMAADREDNFVKSI